MANAIFLPKFKSYVFPVLPPPSREVVTLWEVVRGGEKLSGGPVRPKLSDDNFHASGKGVRVVERFAAESARRPTASEALPLPPPPRFVVQFRQLLWVIVSPKEFYCLLAVWSRGSSRANMILHHDLSVFVGAVHK